MENFFKTEKGKLWYQAIKRHCEALNIISDNLIQLDKHVTNFEIYRNNKSVDIFIKNISKNIEAMKKANDITSLPLSDIYKEIEAVILKNAQNNE